MTITTDPRRVHGFGAAADADVVRPRRRGLHHLVVGAGERVPVLDGRMVPYVNLDNAASTPPFRRVLDAVERFLPYYSSVHRGTGYKSRVSTDAYEQARRRVGEFVGADADRDVVVFTKNTTEAINRLARSLELDPDAVVITTTLEHHSNDLPWRSRARTLHVRARADGTLDLEHLDQLLTEHAGKVAILAVSGASNVTGVVQPVHELAEKVHAVGGRIVVDAAQLAPHRAIDMRTHDDPGHLDFVAFSAHKLYAPFGTGALVGSRAAFADAPDHSGGGTVAAVTLDEIAWAELPDREEAGTPNVVGAIALAAATVAIEEIGFDAIRAHEDHLTRHALAHLPRVPGLTIHGPKHAAADKVGVVPVTVDGFDHGLVAAILGYEHGIGVRSGCFCAHPYLAHLLRLSASDTRQWVARARVGDKRGAPGLVRLSFGCYNTTADIDRAVTALERLAHGDFRGAYRPDPSGSYLPL